ncbi:MAG: hypothetical protein AB7S26_15365 [Sandaracinaceae bacterium]
MTSPHDRLADAIEAWRRDEARARCERWVGEPDASSEADIQRTHARLRSRQAQDLLAEIRERAEIESSRLDALERGLAEAIAAPARTRQREKERALAEARRPYDSDHYPASELVARLERDPRPLHRAAMAAALDGFWRDVAERRAEHAEEAPLEAASSTELERARNVIEDTHGVWNELSARAAHAERVELAHWSDLAFVARAARWDDAAKPNERWRRASTMLAELAFIEALGRAARVLPRRPGPLERGCGVAIVEPARAIRIGPGLERGLASERAALIALGRTSVAALAHPGLPPELARPAPDGIAGTIGALCAHVSADLRVSARYDGMTTRERRELSERTRLLELWELRTAAAVLTIRAERDVRGRREAARSILTAAFGCEVDDGLAGALSWSFGALDRFRSGVAAVDLFAAFRERFDEDFWRNPRAAELILHAAERGAALSQDAWLKEIAAGPTPIAERLAEGL